MGENNSERRVTGHDVFRTPTEMYEKALFAQRRLSRLSEESRATPFPASVRVADNTFGIERTGATRFAGT
jgi:hypothetical protein